MVLPEIKTWWDFCIFVIQPSKEIWNIFWFKNINIKHLPSPFSQQDVDNLREKECKGDFPQRQRYYQAQLKGFQLHHKDPGDLQVKIKENTNMKRLTSECGCRLSSGPKLVMGQSSSSLKKYKTIDWTNHKMKSRKWN